MKKVFIAFGVVLSLYFIQSYSGNAEENQQAVTEVASNGVNDDYGVRQWHQQPSKAGIIDFSI